MKKTEKKPISKFEGYKLKSLNGIKGGAFWKTHTTQEFTKETVIDKDSHEECGCDEVGEANFIG